jgi:DNA-binding transcriptional LysR family regulator
MIFKYLRTFVTIVEQGSVSKAALHLRIAQPALSRHIIELERELGLKLFDRVGRRLLLTGEGAQLLGNCRSLLGYVSSLGEQARQLRSGDRGGLTVAASPGQIETVLSSFLHRYAQRYPKVEVKLIEAVGDKTLDMLDRGEIQIGITTVQAEQIEERGFGCYAGPPLQLLAAWHPKSRLDYGAAIEIGRLAAHPLLLLDSGFFARKTFKPIILIESQAPHTLLALAEAGHGVAILPSVVRMHRYKLRTSRITYERNPLLIPLVITWDKRRALPRFAQDFCELLAAHMRKISPHSRRSAPWSERTTKRPRARPKDANLHMTIK